MANGTWVSLLTPSKGKVLSERVEVLVVSHRDVLVNSIVDQAEITGEHRWPMELVAVKGIGVSGIGL